MKLTRRLLALALINVALLAGCSGLLKSSAGPDRIYVLHAAPAATSGQPLAAVLSVPRPSMHPGLDTDRIALLRSGNELDYYAASHFGEPLSKVLLALVLQSMGGADGFTTTISTERAGVPSDFELLLTARRFEAEYAVGGALPSVEVAIECMLITGAPRRVLGRCDGVASEPVAADRMSEIVLALERATQRALSEMRTKAVTLARSVPAK
ncbi:MAG: ABC-type transport auxiliary lipoprotein family protein [Steroidobacteraceae bacterium]